MKWTNALDVNSLFAVEGNKCNETAVVSLIVCGGVTPTAYVCVYVVPLPAITFV